MIAMEGTASTTAALNSLPKKMAKRAVRKAVNAGGGVFLKGVRRNARRGNGTFRKSLINKVANYPTGSVAVIGQNRDAKGSAKRSGRSGGGGISGRGDVVPTHFIENPIQSHRIAIKKKKVLVFATAGGPAGFGDNTFLGVAVQHPGTKGQFPIRKAAQQSEGEAVRVLTTKLSAETRKEVAALGFTT